MRRILPILVFATVLSAPAAAQDKKAAQGDLAAKVAKLVAKLEKAIKAYISPAKVESRLQARTPRFRVFQLEKNAASGDAAQTEVIGGGKAEPAKKAGPRARLFGDEEKKTLPEGTVYLVDGLPVGKKEIEDLATYFAGYRGGSADTHREVAIRHLIRVRTVQAAFKSELPKLRLKMEELHKKATAKGADFAKIAKEHSHCPSSAQGGALGQFGRDQMVPMFAAHAFKIGVGKVSQVFETHYGFHILKVTGKQKGQEPNADMVAASHVLLMYTKDQNKLADLQHRADSGKSTVAALNDAVRKQLPGEYQ